MKSTLLLLLILLMSLTGKSQQTNKIDDALLMEYFQSQRYTDAAEYLKKNYPEPVTDLKVLSRLAYASQMANRLPDAESFYQRAYAIDTTNQNILFNMAGINLRRGNFPKAEQYYKQIAARDTGNFAVFSQLGSLADRKSDTLGAIRYYEQANRINPDDVDVATELADFYIGIKQFDKALNVLNRAAEKDPENVYVLISKMKLTYNQKKWAETIEAGNKLIQMGTTSAEIITRLGIAYYNLNNYTCGVETLTMLTGIQSTEYTYYYMALCYKGLKDYKMAINMLNQAIFQGISPNIATYYGEMADGEIAINKNKKAVWAYQKALQFADTPTLYYLLANLYDTKLKDKRNARLYYKKYLSANLSAKQQSYIAYVKSRLNQLKN